MTKNADKKREQMMMFSMDSMVPQDHMLRLIDKAINWNFIYDLVEDKYCQNNGRPSMDPVMLIKIPFIQYLYGIKSMRQTIREIEVNVAYRWFLGLDMLDPVPHFSTFGKNYSRRFKDTDLFEQIFSKILEECMKYKLINTDEIFVDATHVKACANSKKMRKRVAHEQALWYEDELQKEINEDRQAHGKKPLKDKNKKNPPTPPTSRNDQHNELEQIPDDIKTKKSSITDPESGWFRKGEHKHVFAYAVETACDEHGWVLGYSVHPGNEHDSRTFQTIYEKVKSFEPEMIVADAGYKTPAIARQLLKDRIEPLFPYKRPMTKKGFFKKYEYVYDEYYDCYICPENQILRYSTTNRDGYREYKSCGYQCEKCPQISKCTESKNHVKVITRHVWEKYIEKAEDIRHVRGNKAIYQKRKETIERIFGTAKEHHGFRYTQYIGKARMEMKAGLTFACMNLKKLARFLGKNGLLNGQKRRFLRNFWIQFNFKGKNGAGMIPAPSLSTVWEDIKYSSLFVYEITKKILREYEAMFDVVFPETEIAYTTMYFETLFQENYNMNFTVNVIVVCNSGLSTAVLLKQRLHMIVPELNVISTCRVSDVIKEAENINPDFIISTVPLKMNQYKVIEVNPLLNAEDVNVIRRNLTNLSYNRRNEHLAKQMEAIHKMPMEELFQKDCCKFNLKISDWKEAVQVAADPLIQYNYIQKEYVDDIIKIIQTIGNYMVFIPEIAFVHAPPEHVNEDHMSLLKLAKPIEFGTKSKVDVKVIIVIASKEENKNLVELMQILMKEDNVAKLKNVTNYDDIREIR